MIPDLRRKLVSILGADDTCTDAQLLEHARHVRRERDTFRDLHRNRPAYTCTWADVQLGQMVVAERGPDAGLAVWMISGRQVLGDDMLKLLFVKLIGPAEDMEIRWLDKRAADSVTVLDMAPVGHGTAALGELGAK